MPTVIDHKLLDTPGSVPLLPCTGPLAQSTKKCFWLQNYN
jgi:hypothetical protein